MKLTRVNLDRRCYLRGVILGFITGGRLFADQKGLPFIAGEEQIYKYLKNLNL